MANIVRQAKALLVGIAVIAAASFVAIAITEISFFVGSFIDIEYSNLIVASGVLGGVFAWGLGWLLLYGDDEDGG